MDEAASIRTAVHFEAMDTFIVTDTCPALLYGVNGCRVHTNVYIDEGYLHDDSPNNPNVTKKKHDLLVPLHFSFILCCLLSEELERVK